jgi:hypothetical protein
MYHGACSIVTPAQTTVASGDTFVKAAGTTVGANCHGFLHSDNRLTFAGQTARTVQVTVDCSMTTSAATEVFLAIFKNGEPTVPLTTGTPAYPANAIQRHVGVAADVGAAAVSTLVTMKKDDYVELWLTTDDGAEVTIEFATMIARVAG